ncbi:MAG: hypothetical protein OER43_18500 [Gammaproteobacteria bacterium]|nr:hypothetical protein [Gammaproteobacteria bacterium]
MLDLFRVAFPLRQRGFRGKRWVNVALRTAHLLGVAGMGGALLGGVAQTAWLPYLYLTLATGLAMMALELWSSAIYLLQVRGQATLLKVALLAAIPLTPGLEAPVVALTIVISGVVSHAPASVRYYSVFHGRVLDAL